MHQPSVPTEVAERVRADGAISDKQFGALILHWFPAAWTLVFSLKRHARPKTKADSREEDDTVPIRILRALGQKPEHAVARQPELQIMRVSVPEMVGEKAVAQVHQLLASDAMHRCAEQEHGVHIHLEDEETFVLVPHGVKAPPMELPALSMLHDRYPLACDQIRLVLADMEDAKRGYGLLDCSRAPKSLEQLVKLMAIQSYRLRVEREHGVELGYQWPGVIAAAPRGSHTKLAKFRSSAEQILAIDRQSKKAI
jgi:hypothetical protein